MSNNAELPAAKIDGFCDEAKRRGCYTDAQESVLASWRTVKSAAFPPAKIDLNKITVGELKARLKDIMTAYGSSSTVKTSSIRTYEAKVVRLINDFITYNGAPDTKWFAWKNELAKKAGAGSSNGSKSKRGAAQGAAAPAAATQVPQPTDGVGHLIRLANNRRAELRVPADLQMADVPAIEKQFAAIVAMIKAQLEVDAPTPNGEGTVTTLYK
jgi:hypothetical protein